MIEFSKQSALLIGQIAILTGILFGNIFLLMAGGYVIVTEYQGNKENDK